MSQDFLKQILRRDSNPDPYTVSHKGITGTGEVLAFCAYIINAGAGQFSDETANRVGRAAARLFELSSRVVQPLQPKRVTATYGILTNIPHFVPRLHILDDSGAEHLGDLLFNFKREPIGVITDAGEVVRLVA